VPGRAPERRAAAALRRSRTRRRPRRSCPARRRCADRAGPGRGARPCPALAGLQAGAHARVSYPLSMDLAFIAKRLDAYERLIRLDKPIGTLLLLWPTLWAVWLASYGAPRLDIVMIFVVGTLLMRSSGCAINDYADRSFDPQVERTRARPLAAREIEPREALVVAAVLALAALGLVLLLNWRAILLSFAAVAIAASYPFTKRFFALPQAYL